MEREREVKQEPEPEAKQKVLIATGKEEGSSLRSCQEKRGCNSLLSAEGFKDFLAS